MGFRRLLDSIIRHRTYPMGSASEDPFRLLRLVSGGLLLVATGFALVLGISGAEPRALLLVGAFWALYGLVVGLIDGVLEPFTDFVVTALQNVGLSRIGEDYSAIETLVARGLYPAAADAYLERATQRDDVEALVRRAGLLAGQLQAPEQGVDELENLRASRRLKPTDDLRVGLALADIYEHRLANPGRAMTELRRLIDSYPSSRRIRQMRRALRALKQQRFGET
jgi:hypothetical protein